MKILVIEDEHRIANSIKRGLEQESFAVDIAYNGLNGYDMASVENYDLIILDLMLPEKGGIEICEDLRSENNHTPILMLTARSELADKINGPWDSGIVLYLYLIVKRVSYIYKVQ